MEFSSSLSNPPPPPLPALFHELRSQCDISLTRFISIVFYKEYFYLHDGYKNRRTQARTHNDRRM